MAFQPEIKRPAGNKDIEADGWYVQGVFDDMGLIEVGASADLLVLRVPFEIDEHLIGRLIHTWQDDYITERVVRGKTTGIGP